MIGYIVKENNIGSAVNEILWYKQTDTNRSCYFYKRMDIQKRIFRYIKYFAIKLILWLMSFSQIFPKELKFLVPQPCPIPRAQLALI